MRFQKFVSRTTKGLFLFLVVIMVVSLVMMGTLGGSGDKEEGEAAGVVFDTVQVTMREWRSHLHKATPSYYWNQWLKEATGSMSRYRRPPPMPPPPKDDQLADIAWENIILLEDARRKGITASEREVDTRLRDIFMAVNRGQPMPMNEESFQRVAGIFHTSFPILESWVADQVLIDKLMGLVEDGEFADFGKVYAELMKVHRLARVWTCAIDPKDFARDLKPVRPEEIAKYYEKNKDRYKVGGKIQIAYLMADYEEFKKKIAEPTEEEIGKFYEEHKGEFQKTKEEHAHKPGEEHKDDEPPQVKSLDEVRAQIPDRIRIEKARVEAKKTMERVDKEIGAAFKDGKYPEDLFDRIKDGLKREGIALAHDVTGAFDARGAADIEKVIGENGDLQAWAFETDRKAGEISKRNDTTKGSLFYRIQKKNASYDPGLTEPVRKSIEKDLEKQQLRRRASLVARNVVQEVEKRGFAAARRKYPLEWRPSRYFGPRNMYESGIEEYGLAQAVAMQIWQGQMGPEKRTATIPGSQVSRTPEKGDLTYVAYLEDVIERFPEDAEEDFKRAREQVDRNAREEYRKGYVTKVKALANLKDLRKKKEEEKQEPSPQKG